MKFRFFWLQNLIKFTEKHEHLVKRINKFQDFSTHKIQKKI